MTNRQEIFSTSFFLYNSAKGFCLHKAKKHNISSTFKFKSKVNQSKNHKQTMLPLFREEMNAQQTHIKQKPSESRKFRSVQLDSQRFDEDGSNRYQRTKFNSVTIQPTFPEIEKKKIKMVAKSYRNIEDCRNQYYEDPVPSSKIFYQKTTKTLQNNHQLAKVNEEVEDLITKEVMKTENQAILRQGQIKFDENQVKCGFQHRKRYNNTMKKRKKNKEQIYDHSGSDRNNEQHQSPQIITFSPMKTTKIKFETVYPKQRRNSNEVLFSGFTRNKHLRKISEKDTTTNGVKGWQNENISQSEQVFCNKDDDDTTKGYSQKISRQV